jgi:hypothetical protein
MKKKIATLFTLFAFNTCASNIGYLCNEKKCTFKLVGLNNVLINKWTINNKEIVSNELTLERSSLINDESVIKVFFMEKNSIQSKTFKWNEKRKHPSLKSNVIFSDLENSYIGLPYSLPSKFLDGTDYKVIQDRIVKVNNNISIVTLNSTRNRVVKSEKFIPNKKVLTPFVKLKITGKRVVADNYVLSGHISSNISAKAIKKQTLVTNNNLMIPVDKNKNFEIKLIAKEVTLSLKVNTNFNVTYTDKMVIKNPLVFESECDFKIDNDLLIAFCMNDEADITKMEYIEDEYSLSKTNTVNIAKVLNNRLLFSVTYSDQSSSIYKLDISDKNNVQATKKE